MGVPLVFKGRATAAPNEHRIGLREGARLGDSRRIGRDPRSSAEVDFVGLCGGMQVGSQGLHRGATTAAHQGAVEHVTSVGVSTWQESAGLACRW